MPYEVDPRYPYAGLTTVDSDVAYKLGADNAVVIQFFFELMFITPNVLQEGDREKDDSGRSWLSCMGELFADGHFWLDGSDAKKCFNKLVRIGLLKTKYTIRGEEKILWATIDFDKIKELHLLKSKAEVPALLKKWKSAKKPSQSKRNSHSKKTG